MAEFMEETTMRITQLEEKNMQLEQENAFLMQRIDELYFMLKTTKDSHRGDVGIFRAFILQRGSAKANHGKPNQITKNQIIID